LSWLNGSIGTSFRFDGFTIESRGGTWLTAYQDSQTFIDSTPAVSYTSPYCLEGRASYASTLQITTNYVPPSSATDAYDVFVREKFFGNAAYLSARPALRSHFYSDVPLAPVTATTLLLGDSSTGAHRNKTLTWQPFSLADHGGETYFLRKDDALLLQSDYDITITAPDGTETTLANPSFLLIPPHITVVPFVFETPGVYSVASRSGTLTVRSIETDLSPEPTVLMNEARDWTPSILAAEADLSKDEGLELFDISPVDNQRTVELKSSTTLPAAVVARLGENGPILSSASVNTLVKYGNAKSTWDIVQTYSDGTQLWRGQLSFGGNLPEGFRVVITPYRAGVTFMDGTTSLELTAEDFDANGIYTYYILKASGMDGSPCHNIYVYDGDTLLWKDDL
jgi:hypothetical protein